jgi:hypothetical protein
MSNKMIMTAVVVVLYCGLCSGCAGAVFAPSLRETVRPFARSSSDDIEDITSLDNVVIETSAVVRMVVQVNGRDLVLPEGWDILLDTDEELLLGTADGRLIEVMSVGEGAHLELMRFAAEPGASMHCEARGTCRVDFTVNDYALDAAEGGGMIFRASPVRRITAWTVGQALIRVEVPADSRNRETAILLAAEISQRLVAPTAP